jgi:hypothetical protein
MNAFSEAHDTITCFNDINTIWIRNQLPLEIQNIFDKNNGNLLLIDIQKIVLESIG